MTLLAAENISKRFNDKILFDNLSFSLNNGDKIGLVGPNGIGKTTLFEMIAGHLEPDTGKIVRSRKGVISYVEQELDAYGRMTLFEFVSSARDDLIDLRARIADLEKKLHVEPDSQLLLEELGELQHRFEVSGGYNFESEIRLILIGLGFPENRFHNRLSDFSGGEKNRAALARVLIGIGNVLLLDEPTNHLDIESTIWLEEYLKELGKTYIIVSHDRTFLNNTIEKIWEINGGKIEQYFNGFEGYLVERETRKSQLEHQYKHQQEEIKKIEDFIRRNIAGQKTKQAQSRRKYLAKLKRVRLPQADYHAPTFRVQTAGRSYNLVLSLKSACFGYGNHALISAADYNIYRGEKIGLIGRNGSGKSTILKTLVGELELLEGAIDFGAKANVAYFDQELSDLNDDNTVIDELWMVEPTAEAGTLRSFLARFGYRGEDIFKKVAVLSGGEKTKLVLARLLFHPANFLIFDEPTNHLDIDSRQALETALKEYQGTLLIVSHDRYFLDQVVGKIIAIEDGSLRVYDGNYSYYNEKKEVAVQAPGKRTVSPKKVQDYVDFKKASQAKGRLKKNLRLTREQIEKTEARIERLDRDIRYNIPKSDWAKLAESSHEKTRLEESLLELYHKLEELERLNAEHPDFERQSD